MNKKIDKELYKRIDDILWFDWDPIGINDSAPRDEYESYTPPIYSLKVQGASLETITDKLYSFEVKGMGIFGGRERCERVAKKIIEINL